jgi:thiaminase
MVNRQQQTMIENHFYPAFLDKYAVDRYDFWFEQMAKQVEKAGERLPPELTAINGTKS